ncbi:unnamed protein product [Discosporangium mesarthrocarpum]
MIMRLSDVFLSFGAVAMLAPGYNSLSAVPGVRPQSCSMRTPGHAGSPGYLAAKVGKCLHSRRLRRPRPGSERPLRAHNHDHSHDHAAHGGSARRLGGGVEVFGAEELATAGALGRGNTANCDLDSHGGHSHGGHGHFHTHAHFHLNVDALKTKPALARLFLAATCVLALPLWRRSSRLEWGALGGVALFLAAVDVGKFAIQRLRVSFGELYLGWLNHSGMSFRDQNVGQRTRAREVDTITWLGALVNVGLAGFKFFAGILGHSAAMIADAGHSLSDLLSDAVTLWAVRLSRLPPDDDHPYGHGRFEAVGAFVISVMLIGAGYGIGNHSYETLVAVLTSSVGGGAGAGAHAHAPTVLTAVAATISIVSKEALYRVTSRVGKQQNSQVLIANAWHHRSDAVSSVVALVAILGSRMGAPLLDPIAGLLVAGMVALTGVQVCSDSLKQLTDEADIGVRKQVAAVAGVVPGVVSLDRIRARQMGPQTLVDLTIQTEGLISASSAQLANSLSPPFSPLVQVAQRVRWEILEKLPFVADVLVNIAVEDKPCPVMSSLRPQEDIEQDIRRVLTRDFPDIEGVPKVMVHYINMVTTAEVFVRVSPSLKVWEVMDIARRAKRALAASISDLCSAQVHLGE